MMIQRFKKTSLVQAMLGLVCLSLGIETCAQTPTQVQDYAKNFQQGDSFFQQYYLTPQQIAESNTQNLKPSSLCSGTWVTPIAQDSKASSDPTQTTSIISAEQAYYNPQGTSFFEGDVTIEQQGRNIRADKISIDATQTHANAQGRVQLAQGGLFAQSDAVTYNLKTQTGDLSHSYYISEQQQAHGYATQIKRTTPNSVLLENANFSTCEPSVSPAWHIQAKTIELNQETGRGITRDARLYVKDIPILPIPYFNFPIDDRRTTGFLTPAFGYTNDGGVQLSTPYYLNLAPNYDLTVTPRYMDGRGAMLENQLRYLTEAFGEGQIWGGYLSEDQHYQNADRKSLHLQHQWQVNPQWQTALDLNYVSDKDYFTDLDNSSTSQDQVHQERTWQLNYANHFPALNSQLNAQLNVQDFQTLDTSIADIDRPYTRLPQFLLHYQGGQFDGFEYAFQNDTAYFKKSIRDGSALESSGTRIYNQLDLSYNYRNAAMFATPKVTLRSINTFFDQDTKRIMGYDIHESVEKSVAVPQFSLDSGVIFEKQGDYLQSISPRLFYAYAPYQNQEHYPNFDSTAASISYDQLFSPYRFYGHDRLEDNHFTSLGVTYRLYDPIGLERLRASIGQSYYFTDRRVHLNQADPIASDDNSGIVTTLASQLSNHIHVVANAAWLANGHSALNNLSTNYADEQGRLYSVGYYQRANISEQGQQAYKQIAGSFAQPIDNNFRLLGHVQYDIENEFTREWLLGLNYESCCWGMSIYARSYYNDLDDPTKANVSAKRAIMAEFSLKGLGGLSGKLTSLLENRVIGFNHANQTWTQR
jgi:LPS-assembly protein